MKKGFVIILLVVGILGIYLNKSYAYFYDFISQKSLLPPPHPTKTVFSNLNNPTIKYAALGDSLTDGVGVTDYKNTYPYLLAQKLSLQNNVELFNFGRSGATADDLITNQLPQTLTLDPDFVTVFIGINDLHSLKSTDQFKADYTQIIDTLKKSQAKIYLLSLPYLGSNKIVYFPYNFLLDFQTKQFNKIIKTVAKEAKVEYIDLYSLEKPMNFYSEDLFHPGEEGYQIMFEAINVN